MSVIPRWLFFRRNRLAAATLPEKETIIYPPLSELFSIDQLDKHGETMAHMHRLDNRRDRNTLLLRLAENERILSETYLQLIDGDSATLSNSPAAVWLLDNFFLIEEQIQLARQHLPKKYSRELPRLGSGNSAGLPRVYAIVKDLISHVDGQVDEDNLRTIVAAYQRTTPLKLGELWAIPIMLRFALIENLRRIAVRIASDRHDRTLADLWATRMLTTAEQDPKSIVLDLSDMARANITMRCAFIAKLVQKLHSHNPALTLVLTWIEQRLAEQGQTIERQVYLDSQQQAINHIAIGNSITSLRILASIDWKYFVEAMSRVETILRTDPAEVYPNMDFTTRDRYRHVIEKVARQYRTTEEDVAVQAVALAQQNTGGNNRTNHVGYYLIGHGQSQLEHAIRICPTGTNKPTAEQTDPLVQPSASPLTPDKHRAKNRQLYSKHTTPFLLYAGSITLITAGFTFFVLMKTQSENPIAFWASGFLMLLGFSQAALSLVNLFATMVVPPRILPRMDFTIGIPPESRTLLTVPTMLTNRTEIADLLNKMEMHYLSNRADNLYFSLLTDFEDASTETLPDDALLLGMAKDGIKKLNDTYTLNGIRPFLLFHRSRQWNALERSWMGYERKRGKLEALTRFLRSQEPDTFLVEGDRAVAQGSTYVLTLDSDTELPRDCARHLIETMAHPLNTPLFDEVKRRVVDGYAILQPRVVSSLPEIEASWYAHIFGSETGIDPYTRAVSDVYQDLFGEGSFIGKGIYDVNLIHKTLADQLPENRILSHDLLEGAYCRSGLVSDIQLIDDFPQRYSEDISRRHRWIRGDWQIAAWLGLHVPGFKHTMVKNPLSLLSRWKIFDNLRRSIVPCGQLLLIVTSWLYLTPSWTGMAVVIATLLLPLVPGIGLKAVQIPARFPFMLHIQSVAEFTGLQLFQAFFTLTVLPFEACNNIDALLRSHWRMFFTQHKLLQWTVSGKTKREKSKNLLHHFVHMGTAPLLALAFGIFLYVQGHFYALPLLGLWFFSPLLPWWISRPCSSPTPHLSQKQVDFLKKTGRKTWRFFESFAGPQDNWLPADNYQEEPREATAHRTSPTNIGLMLLSNLGAYDMGYLCSGQLIDRTRKSFATMETLPRFRGHFFNWYDTKTLSPLEPHYVSMVDSGNLAGYLLTLRPGLFAIANHPLFRQGFYKGLLDTLIVLKEALLLGSSKSVLFVHNTSEIIQQLDLLVATITKFEQTPVDLKTSLHNLRGLLVTIHEIQDCTSEYGEEIRYWINSCENQCLVQQNDVLFLAPWLQTDYPATMDPAVQQILNANRTLQQIAQLREILPPSITTLDKHNDSSDEPLAKQQKITSTLIWQLGQGINRAQERVKQLDRLAGQCQTLANQDYDFLYDTSRNLLAIGYDVSQRRRDASFYDLLASESRLGSFIGIAQGKLPVEHWFSLGRLVTIFKGKTLLLSWGGSMFEYLMPQLILPTYDKTLLGQTYKAVIHRQMAYGRKRGVPWGISESAENSTDANLNYQYRSFGVPGIGFKHGMETDLVIAPYASALALMVEPSHACENMQRLAAEGYEGRYGLYEAIDYSANRRSHKSSPTLIRSFMAHHQGMSFISIVNFFTHNRMIQRFESDPLFSATTLLLQERVPKTAPFLLKTSSHFKTPATTAEQEELLRIFTTPHTTIPEIHLLSNGRYHVMVSGAGGGYSKWNDVAVTRWTEDATRDNCGTFVYVNDITNTSLWSAAFQPTCVEPKNYEAIFSQARAEFKRRDQDLITHTEIAVSPENDIEIRRVTLSDFSAQSRIIELTSYAEVVLTTPQSDAAHPAFSNLFVQTEILQHSHAILCTRRPRSPQENSPWMFHIFSARDLSQYELSYTTDRLAFIGRGLTTMTPRALQAAGPLDAIEGSVLDPIVSIRCRLTLEAGETTTVSFISGMASTREEAIALIDKYQDQRLTDRVFDMALVHGKVMLRQLNATEADAQQYGKLAGSIIYANRYRRAAPNLIIKNMQGQPNLWAYGISGDLPIVLLRIGDRSKIELIERLIQAHAYWRLKGLPVDLVIWNDEQTGYRQEFRDQIVGLIAASPESAFFDRKGGIFLRHPDQMSEEDQILMLAAARVVILDTGGTLTDQILHHIPNKSSLHRLIPSKRSDKVIAIPENFRQDNLLFFNGWGGFTQDGREYIIQIKHGKPTPMPWVNVVANRHFGTVISQSGGYTWSENAHEFRLTPWHNDPVSDTSGEAMYIRDESTGQFWSATPQPAPGSGDYLNRHGFGYSVFEHTQSSLKSEMWIYVDIDAPVKFWVLKIRNDAPTTRKISATGFLELVMGEHPSKTRMHVRTNIDAKTGAIMANNPFNTEFPNRVAFFEASEDNRSVSGDRTEFIGRNGSLANPRALSRVRLSGTVGAGLDPAAALQVYVELEPGQEKVIVFILGVGQDSEDARNLVLRFRSVQAAHAARDRVWHFWNHTLGAININSPDQALNVMANGWLLYQVIAARLWARSGFYQSGGAFGFRDQLQDVMALVHAEPRLVREHLLLCASRQFSQGDVQHWWHPPQGRGVRTLISDDFLWLPFVTSEYVNRTGDTGVLSEIVPFLESRPLNLGEESLYDLPKRSAEKDTLYEHCKRAITHALHFGNHGLPLMGSGDWNDGMNLVGIKGEGESVWLAFFLYAVLKQFNSLAQIQSDMTFSSLCREEATRLQQSIESKAWDGSWYMRAYFDDGTTLGSSQNQECKIDATVQAWSLLSGAGNPDRSRKAMLSLENVLIDHDHGLIKLLDPPFDTSPHEPGYIKGYVPGVRENGGQYTHAAVWAVMAFALLGETRRVHDLLTMINPVNHGSTRDKIERYLVEPYVMAADIYGAEPHVGRGGWTWYTGSASWMYRLIIESVLGLQLKVNTLTFNPCIPEAWGHFTIHYRYRETVYHIGFSPLAGQGEISIVVDGAKQVGATVQLCDDHEEHTMEISFSTDGKGVIQET